MMSSFAKRHLFGFSVLHGLQRGGKAIPGTTARLVSILVAAHGTDLAEKEKARLSTKMGCERRVKSLLSGRSTKRSISDVGSRPSNSVSARQPAAL